MDTPSTPIVGVAAVHVRDTEHQQPTQILGQRLKWPSMADITTVVDTADLKSSTGYYGGPLPDHSLHWNQYFSELWNYLPTGKEHTFNQPPDPTGVVAIVADDQQAVTGNSTDAWQTLRSSFARMWSKGSPPATYKQSHP